MLIVVFLLLGVQGEWVKISQQVLLKPLRQVGLSHNRIFERTTLSPFKLEDTRKSERTKPNRIYINSSLTDYKWNKHHDSEDFKWINEDISGIAVTDKVYKNVSANVKGDVIKKHNDVNNNSKNNLVNINKTNTSDKRKLINRVFLNSNKLRRIYLTSSEKPKVIHHIDRILKDNPIEVLNLSDIDYTDTDSIVTAENPVKEIKNHITTSLLDLQDKQTVNKNQTKNTDIEKRFGNLTTNINNSKNTKAIIKNTERVETKLTKRNNTISTRDQTNETKIISTTLKSTSISNTKLSNNIATTTKAIIQKGQDKSPVVKRLPTKAKIQKVHLTSTKATPQQMPVVNHDVIKDSTIVDTQSEAKSNKSKNSGRKTETTATSIKPVASTTPTKYQKLLFKPVMKPFLPSPDDIMVKELLKEDEIVKKNKINVTSTTETIDLDSKKLEKNEINKQPSTKPQIGNPEQVTIGQIEEKYSENLETDNPDINSDDNDNFEDVIYSHFDTDTDQSDQIPIKSTNVPEKSTLNTETTPNQDDVTEAYVETYGHHYHPIILSESKPEFITKKEIFDENQGINNKEHTETTTLYNEKPEINKNKPENTKSEVKEKENYPNSLENLVRFLKLVTETISRNARKTLKGKTRYLEDLRDTIMANIEQRIEAEFPDDAAPRRSTREARGHVEFPSYESALMTISFLTFAVFLIKLVLQLIYAYKYKTMVAPAVVATIGRAYSKFQHRPDDS